MLKAAKKGISELVYTLIKSVETKKLNKKFRWNMQRLEKHKRYRNLTVEE